MGRVSIVLGLVLATVAGGRPATAQSQDPDTAIRFNLSPPGARSLGLGGAFLGLADDATAAYTNPAGLTNLTVGGSEVAVEFRHWQYNNSFLARGHEGPPTGFGIDTVAGLERSATSSSVTGLSFLSFAWVLPRGLTVAFYRHELARFETAFDNQGVFLRDPGFDGPIRTLPRRSATDLEVLNYGVAGAFELELPPLGGVESTLSIGLGLSYFQLDLLAETSFFDYCNFISSQACLDSTSDPEVNRRLNRLAGGFFGPPDFLGDNLYYDQTQTADADDVGLTVGWLWKLGRDRRWSLGGVFRQGAEFETLFTITPGCGLARAGLTAAGATEFVCSTAALEQAADLGLTGVSNPGVLHVPDFLGLGVAFRAGDGKTRVTLDLSRTRYSQRLIDFTLTLENFEEVAEPFFELDEGNPAALFFPVGEGLAEYIAGFRIRDADEVHLGVERVFLVVESLFVGTARFGVWNEPFHELEFVGENALTRTLFNRPQDDELHYSAGFGLVIKEDYQIDLALDLSDVANTFSFSVVKFF